MNEETVLASCTMDFIVWRVVDFLRHATIFTSFHTFYLLNTIWLFMPSGENAIITSSFIFLLLSSDGFYWILIVYKIIIIIISVKKGLALNIYYRAHTFCYLFHLHDIKLKIIKCINWRWVETEPSFWWTLSLLNWNSFIRWKKK